MKKTEIKIKVNDRHIITLCDELLGNIELRFKKPTEIILTAMSCGILLNVNQGTLCCSHVDIDSWDDVFCHYELIARYIIDNGEIREYNVC